MKKIFSLFLAALFFFSGIINANASSATTFGNNFTPFGTQGDGSGNFSAPRGVFHDTTHNKLYVADLVNSRVVMMDSGSGGTTLGSNFTTFGTSGSGSGNFNGLRGISVDTANNKIYVADYSNNRIVMIDSGTGGTTLGSNFTTFGTSGSGSGNFTGPIQVFVDPTNNKLYVSDFTNNRIVKMDSGSGGTTLGSNFTTFGTSGSGSGNFSRPEGMFVDVPNNRLYIADSSNSRIVIMDSGTGGTTFGNHFTTFGTSGSGSGQFNNPLGVFLDTTNKKIYVTNNGNDTIVIMDSGTGGTTIGDNFTTFGSNGTGSDQFWGIWGIFVDNINNKVYISDYNNSRIVMMDSYSPATNDNNNSNNNSSSDNDSSQKAKIDSWSAFKYTDNSYCKERLNLAIKGHRFNKAADVYIGKYEAYHISRKSSQKLVVQFCLTKLTDNQADHTKYIYVQNPDTDKVSADDKIDLDTILDKNGNSNSIDNNSLNNNQPSAQTYSGDAKPNTCSYTVQSGDNLWNIAKQVYGNATAYPLIIDSNKDQHPEIANFKLNIGENLSFNNCSN